MTANDARLIARELYKLWLEDHEQAVSVKEAAALVAKSESYIYHNLATIPHVKVGKSIRIYPSKIKALFNI